MNRKIKLLALTLAFNLIWIVNPGEIFKNKAFAEEYSRGNFFSYTKGESDTPYIIGNGSCPSTLEAGDKIYTYAPNNEWMKVIYEYGDDLSKSKKINPNEMYEIEKISGIKKWKLEAINSDYNENNIRDVILVPLVREYDLDIAGKNSDVVKICTVDDSGNLNKEDIVNKIDVNYDVKGNEEYGVYIPDEYADYYRVSNVTAITLSGEEVGQWSDDGKIEINKELIAGISDYEPIKIDADVEQISEPTIPEILQITIKLRNK